MLETFEDFVLRSAEDDRSEGHVHVFFRSSLVTKCVTPDRWSRVHTYVQDAKTKSGDDLEEKSLVYRGAFSESSGLVRGCRVQRRVPNSSRLLHDRILRKEDVL